MNVVPSRGIYLATPRSASRSCAEVLTSLGYPIVMHHHSMPKDVVKYRQEVSNIPTVTILRDPLHILFSFWWAYRPQITFGQYIRGKRWNGIWGEGRLYPYWEMTDVYVPYSQGIYGVTSYLRLPWGKQEVPQKGVRPDGPDRSLLMGVEDKYREILAEHYPEDVALYEREIVKIL